MKFLKNIFSFSPEKETAHELYKVIVHQSRQPVFYKDLGVADTLEGRFDMITLHMILVLRRMKTDAEKSGKLSQALFDYMIDDIDYNLREMGIGDMGMGKRVKKLAKGFYGRLEAYDKGLEEPDDAVLCAALIRNLYRDAETPDANPAVIAAYMREESERLAAIDITSLMSGQLEFGPAPQNKQES